MIHGLGAAIKDGAEDKGSPFATACGDGSLSGDNR
jgi:hypothetical protein